MEKRTLLAFMLMALVLVVSQYLFTPPPPDGGAPADTAGVAGAPGEEPAGDAEREPAARAGPIDDARREPAPAAFGAGVYAAPGGPRVHVQTPLYRLSLARRGGVVTDVFLKEYPSFVDPGVVQLVPEGQAFLQRRLVTERAEIDLTRWPFSSQSDSLRVEGRPDSLVLTANVPEVGTVRQIYRFDPDTYVIAYRLEAPDLAGGAVLQTRLGPSLRSTEKSPSEDRASFAAFARGGGEVQTLKPKDVARAPASFRGAATWAGMKSKYFLGALIAGREPFDQVRIEGQPHDSLPLLEITARIPVERGGAGYQVYLGPQAFRGLAAAGAGLEDVNQYGWSWIQWAIQPFATIILRILLWMHKYVPNYGVVLIIFGILVRLLMWPLTQKSFESMQKMQAIQPEMQRVRERYKNDPQRMQQEMMRLYKERGVNPLGGCLPNLLPLPILFALFFVFQNTIELRGAPFVAWIQDLSRPDPYFVLPILMGVTMFVQQKLTTPSDNPQMKMMTYFMPPFLTFIFLNLASGLVLYYTVSNVLTFAQQLMMRRGTKPPAAGT